MVHATNRDGLEDWEAGIWADEPTSKVRRPMGVGHASPTQAGERPRARSKGPMAPIRSDRDGGAFELAWDRFAGKGGDDLKGAPPPLDAPVILAWIVVCVLAGAAIVRVAVHL